MTQISHDAGQLRKREYADHYNTHRPHRTLRQEPPPERPDPPAEGASIQVLRKDRLGGLIHEYAQAA
jgi:putative transposase